MDNSHEMPVTLLLSEIYTSIQGESSLTGWPCVLIRLAGCPLRCCYCDTPQALEGGEEIGLPDLLATVKEIGIPLVEVTGGEPLAQAGGRPLIRALVEEGYQVLVETGGGVSIEGVDPRARIILDVKTPDSGMHERQDWGNLDRLRPGDEVKFVICSRADYEWAREYLQESGLAQRHLVHFSPVETGDSVDMRGSVDAGDSVDMRGSVAAGGSADMRASVEAGGSIAARREDAPDDRAGGISEPGSGTRRVSKRTLAEWILEDRLHVRLNLQLHVWIWGAGEWRDRGF